MNALIEAYKGYYEDELRALHAEIFAAEEVTQDFDQWAEREVLFGSPNGPCSILGDTPKERLEIYLQWQGIIGFTETIWAIAQGEF